MKKILLLLIIMTSLACYSQEELAIDYADIKSKVSNPKLPTFYPKLLKRYNEFDTTLTLEDKAMIYYGFSFQDNYIRKKPSEVKLDSLIDANDYEAAVIESQKILDLNPVSLNANNQLGYAFFKLGKPETEWKKYQNRYRDFRKIIALSGNGSSCQTSFKVIYVDDEYDMMYSYFEIPKVKRQSLEQLCDKIEIESGTYYKPDVIYFDASRMLLRRQEILNEKKN